MRALVVPATMRLMGDLNWWTPKWLGGEDFTPTIVKVLPLPTSKQETLLCEDSMKVMDTGFFGRRIATSFIGYGRDSFLTALNDELILGFDFV